MLTASSLKEFSFKELKMATGNFSLYVWLGDGDSWKVYKGWMDEKTLAPSKSGEGMVVAVKDFNIKKEKHFELWQSDVNFLGRNYHPNLIGLLGYCWEDEKLLLVSEYMPRGGLNAHLFKRGCAIEPLSWAIRLKIAIGAARSLTFLHNLEKKVIYRDFKTYNILLDENYNAKLTNFSLARWVPSSEEVLVSTVISSTSDYIAPECFTTGNLYLKSDVYSFGVVLLELLMGLKVNDPEHPCTEQNLVDWLKPILSQKTKLKTIMDARMEGQYPSEAALQAAQLSLRCLELDPQSRPSMKEVVEVLKEIEAQASHLHHEEEPSSNYDNSIEFSGASSCSAGKSPISGVQDPNMQISRTPGLKEYSVADLKIATNNFSPDSLLGERGFGKVYKGWIYEKTLAPSSKRGTGMAVAIKILNPDGPLGFDEWQYEVNFLGRHYHPNLIGLVGYCWEAEMLVIVYEFMQEGSLDKHLFRSVVAIKPLSWDIRLKIAIGAARGLAFLHTLEKKVIHRDIKTTIMYLDENYNVKLSGFSLAMRGPCDEESHISTSVMGTYGYAAPEYVATGNIYLNSDVYGFGVVLLELLTGLRALDTTRPNGKQNLVEWLKPKLCQKKELRTIMDVRMKGQYTTTAAFQAAELTEKCLDSIPENRPSMKEVVEVLKEIEAMEEETNNSKV